MASKKLDMPLFKSDEIRDIILGAVAAHTEYFTPRYIANIATIAKSHLIDRVAKAKEQIIGLTEADLAGYAFDVSDWEMAFAEVAEKYDRESVKRRDEEPRQFVKKYSPRRVGFASGERHRGRIFPEEVFARLVAAETKLELGNSPAAE